MSQKNQFSILKPEEITENTFKLIGKDWMLITAGTYDKFNMMTASWGGLGVLWSKNVCFCFIRPQRYTYDFVEKSDTFTLSFFGNEYREALNICGTKSGREIDKVQATGLTPFEDLPGMISFREASLIVECKKIYYQDIKPENFLQPDIQEFYKLKDYHRMYIGEIIRCLKR
ncbi:MAG TPA: flavin reductase family protein [Clostridiaceae bacterium]|nr:flavin reductase family protein [Clostridiaceae bacterium]